VRKRRESRRARVAREKTTPKSERPVRVGPVSLLPGNRVTIGKKKYRVTDDGAVEVRSIFGWRPVPS
jgi:hypothetical protein